MQYIEIPTEATYTKPRPDCPHPERWHAPDVDSAETEVSELVGAFVRALQPDLVVETGTAYGFTALVIADALERNGQGTLYTVEIDEMRAQRAWATMIKHVEARRVVIKKQSSMEFEPSQPIDFAWFDSLPDLRVQEFLRYRTQTHYGFRPGAIVGFHDCGPQHEPLRSQVEALANDGLIRPIYLRTPRGVIFAEVL